MKKFSREKKVTVLFATVFFFGFKNILAQNLPAEIHGSFVADGQYYFKDTLIGAPDVPSKFLFNGYGDITATKGNFRAGIRFESYEDVMLGYDARYKGSGIAHRYIGYTNDELDITVGNFYEQFGSGLILRAYWEPTLGYDNAIDGLRIKYNLYKGVYLKGLIGRQRFFFAKGPGIVRGADGEVQVNELLPSLSESKSRLTVGGSFVSKYQSDTDPTYKLPENVASWAGRLDFTRGKISVNAEYVYKYNDPSAINNYSYKFGDAMLLKTTYSQKGFGILLAAKRIDNMNFRSDRNANLNTLLINYLPALTKYHTYSLATIYPYSTQPNGEIGYEAEVNYSFKKGSMLGGEYGTNVVVNYSGANGLDTSKVEGKDIYKSDYGKMGTDIYYQDVSVEINKKISKSIKFTLLYANQVYDKDKLQAEGANKYGTVYAHLGVADITFKLSQKNSIRTELQTLQTEQDFGSWASALIEFSNSPHWFVAVGDQYNYGNDDKDKRIHYYIVNIAYVKNASRLSIGYGKQREGLFCVGGVCRQVPASNGITISISTSF